jgi:predicted HTH transcriptional regulator
MDKGPLVSRARAIATAEQLAELDAALADEDGRENTTGVAVAWARIVLGITDVDHDRYALAPRLSDPEARGEIAVELAVATGQITSRTLATICGVHPETARQELHKLTTRGMLQAHGANRGRVYRLPEAV